ncbi:hypothetical protein KEJ50_01275 [Candidatus Bathyarchaeota archaeon]|nr:hypothetical protein [Candidatus Bathyarchaeota archaeon]
MNQKIFATIFLSLFLLSLTLSPILANNNEATILIRAEPSYKSIKAGEVASFSIKVESLTRFRRIVILTVEGLPENTIGIFTPEKGRTPFHSKLTIITTIQTPEGAYEITITAVSGDKEEEAKVGLIINPPEAAITSTSTTQTTTRENILLVNVQTDEAIYTQNDVVKISGSVQDRFKNPVEAVEVSIQIVNPLGNVVHSALIETDSSGIYFDNFTIGELGYSIFINGTYTVFVTASKFGYIDGYAHATFIVGESNLPSVNFVSINITDSTGEAIKSEFTQGESLIIWVTVENSGEILNNAYVWLEIDDPNGTPIKVDFHVGDLEQGKTITEGFSFIIPANAVKGIYSTKAFVSDKLISQGGKFLASIDAIFMVN